MTITQIRAFYLAATLGSFTAAAEYMGLTQPTISELVRKVEDQYGMALFVRRGRRLVLTTAGQALMPWAKRLLDAELGADSALTALSTGEGGTVSFGILKNANYYHLSELAAVFREAHPNVRIRLLGQNSFEVADAVRNGTLEAGLLCLPVPTEGLHIQPLMRHEILWASSKPERCMRPMSLIDMPKEPFDPLRCPPWRRGPDASAAHAAGATAWRDVGTRHRSRIGGRRDVAGFAWLGRFDRAAGGGAIRSFPVEHPCDHARKPDLRHLRAGTPRELGTVSHRRPSCRSCRQHAAEQGFRRNRLKQTTAPCTNESLHGAVSGLPSMGIVCHRPGIRPPGGSSVR